MHRHLSWLLLLVGLAARGQLVNTTGIGSQLSLTIPCLRDLEVYRGALISWSYGTRLPRGMVVARLLHRVRSGDAIFRSELSLPLASRVVFKIKTMDRPPVGLPILANSQVNFLPLSLSRCE
jgi:hypothetical protein